MSLFLQSISVVQFKNYTAQQVSFTARIVGICGRNGIGKTNLLDAIYYLCFTKSYFSKTDATNVQHGLQGFRVEGSFIRNGKTEKAICIVRGTGKKEFSLNDENYQRFSKHIGHLPCVVIAPDDVELIVGTSDARRKFIDTILSQLDNAYLQALIQYNKILQQRNSFLRSLNDGYDRDMSVLDILDEQLAGQGQIIYNKRDGFMQQFLPEAAILYRQISQQKEEILFVYDTELHNAGLIELFNITRQKDKALQRTSAGIHRDDLLFSLDDRPFKSTASQGQRKSLLFALKLAEMEMLKQAKGFPPILLLDDVFEKLDEERIKNLLTQVCADKDVQVFITDTNCGRLQSHLQNIGEAVQIIQL